EKALLKYGERSVTECARKSVHFGFHQLEILHCNHRHYHFKINEKSFERPEL
ncbi:1348_t:CDS:1, partial [Funneliformis geosporum]